MKNRLLCPKQPNLPFAIGCILVFTCFVGPLLAHNPTGEIPHSNNNNPAAPVFVDPVPDDITIDCINDLPDPDTLTAIDNMDPGYMEEIVPVDSPDPATIDACIGGTITRTWTASNMGEMVSVSQTITVLADTEPPALNIPPVNDTLSCDVADYDLWINSLRLSVSSNAVAMENCSGIDGILDDAPLTFDDPCGTLTVTFTLRDNCGLESTFVATYTTVDEEAPEILNFPNDTLIFCQDPVPSAPTLMAMDNCTNPLTVELINEVNTQVANGSCTEYEYIVQRTWQVSDSCGNVTTRTQTITIDDSTAPTFTVPDDATISCDDDPDDLSLTGDVSDVLDNCDSNVDVYYQDNVSSGVCPQEQTITRIWRAEDACGNVTGKIQVITVIDNEAPTFTVPDDLSVNCEEANDMGLTGEPTDLADNCDMDLEATFSDIIIAGPCPNSYTIRRVWLVMDECGNFTELDQFITVVDDQAPQFGQVAEDSSVDCDAATDPVQAFQDWLDSRGGATATDNCSLEEDLTWLVFNAGTSDPAFLPPPNCPAPAGILTAQEVDFIVEDECGNRDTTTATFMLVDNTPPSITDCPANEVVETDPGVCEAEYILRTPVIEEECAIAFSTESITQAISITSPADPGNETNVPADPMVFQLDVTNPLPINAVGDAELLVELLSADAEQPSEYFTILGEDGSVLGRTALSPASCTDSDTLITVPAALINQWASDGTITITLEPNIPDNQPGTFAVNDICGPPGAGRVSLDFTVKDLSNLVYEYSIDNSIRFLVDPVENVNVSLQEGEHEIKYFITDCAGNMDSCSFMVTVEDVEPPVLDCPDDVVVSLDQGVCVSTITLPFPDGASDNCRVGNFVQMTLPTDTMQAYLNFNYDPNLNDYLAAEKMYTFDNLAANAFTDVILTLDLQGDFFTTGAFIRIYGDDNSLIDSTAIGVADCVTPGQKNVTIAPEVFNDWASDGMVSFRLVPNPIPIPPGGPGDGINACNTPEVDGGIDSVSYVFATLSYSELDITYYGEGATEVVMGQMVPPAIRPTLEFNQGITDMFYIIEDGSANPDTCSFQVIVEDNEAPTPVCQPTTLFINPSGLDIQTIPASVLDGGSFDNCGIDTMYLTPNTFDCQLAGSNVNVVLTVVDLAGNMATCDTLVRVEREEPMPTANSGLCGGDTLFLFANPPPATGGVVYTYQWNGPNNFTSTLENPVIPSIDEEDAGSYTVQVTGITGCSSSGTVQVNIEDLPLTPVILTDNQVCTDEDIILNSSVFPSGANVTFRWFQGLPPNGTLLGTTSEPSFIIPGPHTVGTANYYMTVEADGCESAPSAAAPIMASTKPPALVAFPDSTVCEGTVINLATPVSGTGITYSWTGPDGFTSTQQFPAVGPVTAFSGGFYTLVLSRNGCESDEVSIELNVLPKPATPNIVNNGPLCAGETIVLSTSASGASTYHWVPVGGQGEFVTTTNSYSIQNAQVSNSGQWYVYVKKFGCSSNPSPNTNVVVNAVPVAGVSATPPEVCAGNNLQLNASSNIPGSTFQWSGPNGFNSVSPNPQISNVTQSAEGTYEVQVTSPEGCSATAAVTVDVLQSVTVVEITDNAPECLSGPTDIEFCASVFPVDNGTYDYEWRYMGGIISNESCAMIPNATEADNGTYTLVVFTEEGCPSAMAQTVLDVQDAPATPPQPTISPTTPVPFCTGETIQLVTTPYSGSNVVYFWNTPNMGIQTTANPSLMIEDASSIDNGSYSVSVMVDGCLSSVSAPLTITINPIPQITASSNSPVCRGEILELSTEFIPNATYSWFGPNGFNSGMEDPMPNTTNMNIMSGTYRVVALVNGCTSDTAAVEIQINPTPMIPEISGDASVCVDDPLAILELAIDTMSVTEGSVFTWFGPEQEVIGGPTPELVFDITNFEDFDNDGTFPFYATASLGDCETELSDPVMITLSTIPDIQAFAGDDFSACQGPSILLNAEAPSVGSGRWTLVEGDPTDVVIANPAQATTTVNGLLGGQVYIFRWTLSNGACMDYSSDQVEVMVTEAETAFAGENILACESSEVNLDAMAPIDSMSEGYWSQPQVQETFVAIVDSLDPGTLVTGLEPDNLYTFTWTIVSGCGTTTDQVFVIISDPSPDGGGDAIACNDEGTVELNAIAPTIGSSGRWSAVDPDIVINEPNNENTLVQNLMPGENIFIWTVDEGICGETSQDTVRIFYKMNPIAEPDQVLVDFQREVEFSVTDNDFTPPNSMATVIDGPANGGMIEQIGNGQFVYTPPNNFVGTDELTYELCSEGCECATAKVTFTVGDGVACKVPSVITPNNDGINDAFVVPCLLDQGRFPDNQVIIFNRWGDEVYRSPTPYNNDWRGTFDGEPLPAGTYFYIIRYDGNTPPVDGYLVIQR